MNAPAQKPALTSFCVTNPAGYSGTPLVKKLGLKPEHRAVAVRAPKHYNDLIEQTPIKHEDLVDLSGEYDFIHIFNDTVRCTA